MQYIISSSACRTNAENTVYLQYHSVLKPFHIVHLFAHTVLEGLCVLPYLRFSRIILCILSFIQCFLFATESKLALGPTQHLIQWVPADISLGVKRPEHEADHSPTCSVEVNNP